MERATEEQTTGPVLNLLFRHALETGKRARTETDIARGTASVSHAAVEMAAERLGELTGKRVLVMGAGEMAEGMATALQRAGVTDVFVANRTWRKARPSPIASAARRCACRTSRWPCSRSTSSSPPPAPPCRWWSTTTSSR
ncbi:MAG: hypothetical protein R2746_07480 [Acidimicrobiales bacterium]